MAFEMPLKRQIILPLLPGSHWALQNNLRSVNLSTEIDIRNLDYPFCLYARTTAFKPDISFKFFHGPSHQYRRTKLHAMARRFDSVRPPLWGNQQTGYKTHEE